ncbi:hypothetical protein HF072_15830 [Bacillus sp. RO3]|nr:hypothetical protein [Bacillus sp. RO3]
MTFIIIQDLMDFFLSPLHLSLVLLFFITFIWHRFPPAFQLSAQPYDHNAEGTVPLTLSVSAINIISNVIRFTTCMKLQFYPDDNDDETSSESL